MLGLLFPGALCSEPGGISGCRLLRLVSNGLARLSCYFAASGAIALQRERRDRVVKRRCAKSALRCRAKTSKMAFRLALFLVNPSK